MNLDEAVQQNQKMIEEWKCECLKAKNMAFLMITLTPHTTLKYYVSQGLDIGATIRQFQQAILYLEQKQKKEN
jgi:hypothetical protein